jgi:predicted nucleic acid-binding protein
MQSVYLDSTIPSHYCDKRTELQAFIIITQKWWTDEMPRYHTFTSEYTLAEISRGDYPNKDNLLELIADVPVLRVNDEIDDIAAIYMKEYVMPKGAAGDAFHLACASFYKLDYLLTWNCNHLANANKEKHISIINTKLGLYTPRIVTPLQLFKERNQK